MTAEKIKQWIEDIAVEADDCSDELLYAVEKLRNVSVTIEAYTEAKNRESTSIPDEIASVIAEIESVRKRLHAII